MAGSRQKKFIPKGIGPQNTQKDQGSKSVKNAQKNAEYVKESEGKGKAVAVERSLHLEESDVDVRDASESENETNDMASILMESMKAKEQVKPPPKIADDHVEGVLRGGKPVLPTSSIVNGDEFPELPKKNGAPASNKPITGAWVNRPRIFINKGVGPKLWKVPGEEQGPVMIKRDELPKVEEVWGYTLIGKFVGRFPGTKVLLSIRNSWKVPSTFSADSGFLIFKFQCAEDRDKVLREGPYMAYDRPLLLKPVPDLFAFDHETMASIPMWVRIHGLPMECWSDELLSRIASRIGTPLFMDPVTNAKKKGSYARVLIEINFTKPLVKNVEVRFDDGFAKQCPIFIENKQVLCTTCYGFGHLEKACKNTPYPKIASGSQDQLDETVKNDNNESKGQLKSNEQLRPEEQTTSEIKSSNENVHQNQEGDTDVPPSQPAENTTGGEQQPNDSSEGESDSQNGDASDEKSSSEQGEVISSNAEDSSTQEEPISELIAKATSGLLSKSRASTAIRVRDYESEPEMNTSNPGSRMKRDVQKDNKGRSSPASNVIK